MKIDEDGKYEVAIVCYLYENHVPGDCYDSLAELQKEHPNVSYRFGYVVRDTETKIIPDACQDWNDSIEEALFDYQCNVVERSLERE